MSSLNEVPTLLYHVYCKYQPSQEHMKPERMGILPTEEVPSYYSTTDMENGVDIVRGKLSELWKFLIVKE